MEDERGRITVDVDLDPESGAIRGEVRDGEAEPKPFVGWLGLINALEAWRAEEIAAVRDRSTPPLGNVL